MTFLPGKAYLAICHNSPGQVPAMIKTIAEKKHKSEHPGAREGMHDPNSARVILPMHKTGLKTGNCVLLKDPGSYRPVFHYGKEDISTF
jgi:hypothetical protein